jgi:hypothetical protein
MDVKLRAAHYPEKGADAPAVEVFRLVSELAYQLREQAQTGPDPDAPLAWGLALDIAAVIVNEQGEGNPL